ncbi:hypothetical protein COY28_02290 [Candidatus Woesearchaeota archaeon CG_4_10_14_0_2_um_filter_57_5]|nr:MAG: hypothetical protein AUJ68_01025 [Candidatus Woesearchaeota archaeon CG1_02_57_44]PIN67475.1 MAG: hypothetical protein COV94_07270 [Candidatus Woesearchaeota archaeon CG11_big_fil_rev_8_21_14_0_20_57_5]PIZ54919.1 MAG: hypothetical protein COY28_02290 [Candidatus Woesearchaeota archaeon CG_4_10_14_0_2_um_filter_57_5]
MKRRCRTKLSYCTKQRHAEVSTTVMFWVIAAAIALLAIVIIIAAFGKGGADANARIFALFGRPIG